MNIDVPFGSGHADIVHIINGTTFRYSFKCISYEDSFNSVVHTASCWGKTFGQVSFVPGPGPGGRLVGLMAS